MDATRRATYAEGQPYFSSPGDGNWPRHVLEGSFSIWDLAKPVIAQVHGYCLAGGSELATACDLVYCAEDAKIGYPVVRTMSPPDMQYHPWMMGLRGAMEVMLTGDSISAERAYEIGLINVLCEDGEALDKALELAARITANAPLAVRETRRGVRELAEDCKLAIGAPRSAALRRATQCGLPCRAAHNFWVWMRSIPDFPRNIGKS